MSRPEGARRPAGFRTSELRPYRQAIEKLAPLHARRAEPRPGEWLAEHNEPGQSFEQYLQGRPVTPTGERGALVVQPLGPLEGQHRQIVETVTEYMAAFFGLPARLEPQLSLGHVPPLARRETRQGYGEQLLTTYVLRELLSPRLPDDAMAYVAFTSSDLWPGSGWNYVFGQASLGERVGVWSLARNGPEKGPRSGRAAAERLALVRALKIATHETGHMFGIEHCTAYLCTMAGVNHLAESDAHPTWLCPECLAKIAWATGQGPEEHLSRMKAFAEKHGLEAEAAFYQRELEAVGVAVPASPPAPRASTSNVLGK